MTELYHITIPLLAGFILDLLLGDPLWLPHPIRWFGKVISFFEKHLNRGKQIQLKGGLMSISLIIATFLVFYSAIDLSVSFDYIYYPVTSIFVFYGLANRNLIQEALKVEGKLQKEGLETARVQLSYIVGRDTKNLSIKRVRTAILETLAENLVDGVIAPLFYYMLGGIPLMFTYKMANTLDSMIGYKNEKYKHFGLVAARVDDVFNFVPARLTAILMAIIAFSPWAFRFIFMYGNKHSSPNAGYPEAALAGILNCRLGGPNIYMGELVDKPYIGSNDRLLYRNDIIKACVINCITSIIFLLVSFLIIRLLLLS